MVSKRPSGSILEGFGEGSGRIWGGSWEDFGQFGDGGISISSWVSLGGFLRTSCFPGTPAMPRQLAWRHNARGSAGRTSVSNFTVWYGSHWEFTERSSSKEGSRIPPTLGTWALGATFSHFFALFRQFFRFFSLLGASWAFFDDFLRNFAIFGRFLVDFGQFWDGFWDDFRWFFKFLTKIAI